MKDVSSGWMLFQFAGKENTVKYPDRETEKETVKVIEIHKEFRNNTYILKY